MKRKILTFLMTVSAVLVLSPQLLGGNITHTVTYDLSRLRLGTDTLGGETYTTVEFEGLYNSGEVGSPWLPVDNITFSVPYNATDFSVTATLGTQDSQNLDYPVYPRQASLDGTVTLPDNNIYNSGNPYPSVTACVVDEGMMAGENHVVTVMIMPLKFNTDVSNGGNVYTLDLAESISLTLSYNLSNTPNVYPMIRKGASLREKGRELTRNVVVNPEDVAGNTVPSSQQNQFNFFPEPLDTVENPDTYMIIATDASLRPLRRLAALKMQEGYRVKMVTIDDAITDPAAGQGDSIPGAGLVHTDDAGKLRQYLRHHYLLRGTEYVLLAGTGIPIFSGADIYFSNIDVDWITFESSRGDIFVGRLFGTTSGSFDNYTNKLLRYELNPGNGDFSYLKNGLIIESNSFPLYTTTTLPSIPNCTVLNCITQEEELTGNDVINMIKCNHYGYLSTFNRGFPLGIEIYNGIDAQENEITHYLWAIDTVKVEPGVTDTENENGLNRMDNKNYPFIYISTKGKTIPYEENSNSGISYGESFTMGKDYGGPVYIGSSGNIYSGGDRMTTKLFQSKLFNQSSIIGQVHLLVKSALTIHDHEDAVYCENLLGDPSLDVWSDQAQQYSGITVTRADNAVTVSGITEPSTIISYHSNDGTTGSCETSASSVTLTDVSPNSTIMLNKHNYIPYIAPLVLQNTDLEQSQYVFATDVTAGRAVDSGRTNGGVTVKNGAEYEIEASGEVTLAGGFKVELGARFAVKRTTYK